MVDVVLVDVLYTKVIDDEGKADGAPCMCPISRGDFALTVSGNEEAFLEEFLCENAGLGKAVHATVDFAKVAIGIGDVLEVVFFDDVFGKLVEFILKYPHLNIGIMR